MKCVAVTLLLLAAAGNISAVSGGSRHARETSGSYSGYINGQHYGGSYRTPDNGPTTFNHYGDDAARSAGVLPFVDSSPFPHFPNPSEMGNFNRGYRYSTRWSNTGESYPSARLRVPMMPLRRTVCRFSTTGGDSFTTPCPYRFPVMPRTRTVCRFPNTEVPSPCTQIFQGMPQTRTVSRLPDTEVDSDFLTKSSANAIIHFPMDGKPSPLEKNILEEKSAKEAASYDSKDSNDNAPRASASASGSIGPGGGHQSVHIDPENAASPNINTRFRSDGPKPDGFYEVSSSSSSSYSTANGETVYDNKAESTVNDNGKVTTYVASD